MEKFQNAKLIGQSKDRNGEPIGSHDINPFLNTQIYDVEFPDGEIREYCANVIAENMYSQVDAEGYRYQLGNTYSQQIHLHSISKSFYLETQYPRLLCSRKGLYHSFQSVRHFHP